MKRNQSIYTLTSTYIGTVIGAGFASGQEIFQFFGIHGYNGIIGVVIVTILLSILGALVLNIIYTKRIKNFEEFATICFGKDLFNIVNIILTFLLFISYVVMLSGSGAVVYENFQASYTLGIIIMAVITFCIFIFGIKGIAKANNIIVPFLILIVLWVGINVIYKNQIIFSNLYTYSFRNARLFNSGNVLKFSASQLITKTNWLWSTLLYVGSNSIGAIIVMCSMGPLISDRKAATLGGVLGGVILGILAITILISLLILYTSIIGIEVPMVVIASSLGSIWKQIYSVILILAMFTTAIANGYGSILGICNFTGLNEKLVSIFVCTISIPLAMLGFKKLVAFFYPLFGYIGVLLILTMMFQRNKSFKGFL